ncbi:flagellin [Luteibacter yeojuensis]|uniref:Flagellin n=1 Tax=Luteibacter yeojuensis TaxID=345309 RepID=A0A7X5TRW3_9GAMM|nr:flagellin [Luteibacter yeojuensis]NID16877.1 flagellin [Luteibacter yeojuensis]
MAFHINTNMASFNAQRSLGLTQSRLATAYQRLGSGMRINSAKDDAAGLAIATRFTTQINGLAQGRRNANDGISLAQTSEGALDEVTNNLQRIRQLALQSLNSSNSPEDRKALNNEVVVRLAEITRIATQTSFNGMKVLDGSGARLSFQVGANIGETIEMGLDQNMRADHVGHLASGAVDLGSFFSSKTSQAVPTDWSTGNGASLAAKTYLGVDVNWAGYTGNTVQDARDFLEKELGADFKVTIEGNGTDLGVERIAGSRLDLVQGQLSFTTGSGEKVDVAGSFRSVQQIADVLNANGRAGLSAFVGADGKLHFNSKSAVTVSGTEATKLGFASNYDLNMSTSLADGSVLTNDDAYALIASTDATLETVSAVRSKLGAVQNRLESTVRNLDNIRENLTESRTRIREADVAEESSEKVMATILQQSGMSVLAQANASQQLVLKLLE